MWEEPWDGGRAEAEREQEHSEGNGQRWELPSDEWADTHANEPVYHHLAESHHLVAAEEARARGDMDEAADHLNRAAIHHELDQEQLIAEREALGMVQDDEVEGSGD